MHVEETKGRFGFHLSGGKDEKPPSRAYVQLCVKSSAFSRAADLAISPHLTAPVEIDLFVDAAILALEAIRSDAKRALTAAESAQSAPTLPDGKD